MFINKEAAGKPAASFVLRWFWTIYYHWHLRGFISHNRDKAP